MERYKVSVLPVTETHLIESEHMVLDEVKGYKMLLSGSQDGKCYLRSSQQSSSPRWVLCFNWRECTVSGGPTWTREKDQHQWGKTGVLCHQ